MVAVQFTRPSASRWRRCINSDATRTRPAPPCSGAERRRLPRQLSMRAVNRRSRCACSYLSYLSAEPHPHRSACDGCATRRRMPRRARESDGGASTAMCTAKVHPPCPALPQHQALTTAETRSRGRGTRPAARAGAPAQTSCAPAPRSFPTRRVPRDASGCSAPGVSPAHVQPRGWGCGSKPCMQIHDGTAHGRSDAGRSGPRTGPPGTTALRPPHHRTAPSHSPPATRTYPPSGQPPRPLQTRRSDLQRLDLQL